MDAHSGDPGRIGAWLILSRWVLPRLGARLAANRVTVWTAAAVFLAAWLPFNNGLRPEPLIAFGVIAVWALVEYAIGTRRLLPYAVAIVVAAFSVTLAPQGLIAVAPLLVGARAVARIIRSRRAVDGLVAPLATLFSAAALIFVIVFRDQTLATVAESARIKYVVGPTIAWYQEFLRYYFLTVEDSVDSSLTRRFAVLVLLLCLFGMLTVLLRRSAVPGMARGPVWRLIGTTAIGLLLLTFTPTKWGIQFGAFAALVGALGAVTAFSFARVGLHSRRNVALYVTGLLFVLAWATSGINGWFYVGNYGVPWFDKQPVIAGFPVLTIFLVLAILTGLLAGWLHFRMDYTGHVEVADTGRNRALASTPLLVVAVIMVVLEVGSLAKGAAQRYPVYTTAKANVAALTSGCPRPAARWPMTSSSKQTPMPVCCNRFRANASASTARSAGRIRSGSPRPASATPSSPPNPSPPTPAGELRRLPQRTERRHRLRGGHRWRLRPRRRQRIERLPAVRPRPQAHAGDGQLRREHTVAAKVTSAWYQLPPRTPDRPLVTVAAAGAIWYYEEDGSFNYGQSLKLQWGVHRPDGSYQALGDVQPIDIFPQKAWRNLRFPLAWAPPEANVARIVADDPNLSDRPVVRVHPATGARARDRATTPGVADAGDARHRDRGELPLPAAVLRTSGRRRVARIPHPAQLQADRVVVEHVAVRTGRRPVPVHPGAAPHDRRPELSA